MELMAFTNSRNGGAHKRKYLMPIFTAGSWETFAKWRKKYMGLIRFMSYNNTAAQVAWKYQDIRMVLQDDALAYFEQLIANHLNLAAGNAEDDATLMTSIETMSVKYCKADARERLLEKIRNKIKLPEKSIAEHFAEIRELMSLVTYLPVDQNSEFTENEKFQILKKTLPGLWQAKICEHLSHLRTAEDLENFADGLEKADVIHKDFLPSKSKETKILQKQMENQIPKTENAKFCYICEKNTHFTKDCYCNTKSDGYKKNQAEKEKKEKKGIRDQIMSLEEKLRRNGVLESDEE